MMSYRCEYLEWVERLAFAHSECQFDDVLNGVRRSFLPMAIRGPQTVVRTPSAVSFLSVKNIGMFVR